MPADSSCRKHARSRSLPRYPTSNQNAQARRLGLEALAIFDTAGGRAGPGPDAQHLLGLVADRSGERAEANERFLAAIEAFESVNNRRGRALATLGLLRRRVRCPPRKKMRSISGRWTMPLPSMTWASGGAVHSRADHLFTAGKYEQALDTLEEAASAARTRGRSRRPRDRLQQPGPSVSRATGASTSRSRIS